MYILLFVRLRLLITSWDGMGWDGRDGNGTNQKAKMKQ